MHREVLIGITSVVRPLLEDYTGSKKTGGDHPSGRTAWNGSGKRQSNNVFVFCFGTPRPDPDLAKMQY
jgi:hypothetical protein